MFCHGELDAAASPIPRHLTRFYLMLSLGGALGALLVAIVAPLLLHGYFELNITLVLLALLLLARLPGVGAAGRRSSRSLPTVWYAWERRARLRPTTRA